MLDKKNYYLFMVLCATSTHIYCLAPYYSIRSQGVNAARELAGWSNKVNLCKDDIYGTVSAALEYTRSFKPHNITRCLFGPDIVSDICTCDSAIVISGSQTTDRGPADWLADYFGLPNDFKSIVAFKPRIQNFIADLDFYIGFDRWVPGLYFRLDFPITHTKWFMDMHETVSLTGSNAAPAGYYSGGSSPTTNLLSNFTEFITAAQTPTFNQTPVLTTPPTSFPASAFDPLQFAKISPCPINKAGIAEIRAALGWNWCCRNYHVGFNVRTAAPTGTKPKGVFLFEPIVGNGHHWELGAGITAHWDFWMCEDENRHAGLYFDVNITHLFKTKQRRTFDLKNKPNSRYMLAEKIGPSQLNPQLANPPFPAVQFQNEFSPVANLTTFNVNVSVAAQADLVLMLNYTDDYWSFDLGYNFWGRSCEKISSPHLLTTSCNTSCPSTAPVATFAENSWALKGDAFVIGFDPVGALPAGPVVPVSLAATENNATIHAGTNFPSSGTAAPAVITLAQTNPSIDNPLQAVANDGNTLLSQPFSSPFTHSSNPPLYISCTAIDFSGTRGTSNKLFTHVNYSWFDNCINWVPYFGIGAEVEFGNSGCKTKCNTSNNCSSNSCCNCSLSQWGLWVKAGVSFN